MFISPICSLYLTQNYFINQASNKQWNTISFTIKERIVRGLIVRGRIVRGDGSSGEETSVHPCQYAPFIIVFFLSERVSSFFLLCFQCCAEHLHADSMALSLPYSVKYNFAWIYVCLCVNLSISVSLSLCLAVSICAFLFRASISAWQCISLPVCALHRPTCRQAAGWR